VFQWVPEARRIDPSTDPDVEGAYAAAMGSYRAYRRALCD
jgi:hypothetical protein